MTPRRVARLLALALALVGGRTAAQGSSESDVSLEREREATAQIHAQIRQKVKLMTDPGLVGFVNELGGELVKAIEPTPFIYRFFIIQDPRLNAFTIGGGYVYINSGVIEQAGDVTELLGVLAHEIGHVDQRHVARQGEGQGLGTLATLASLAAVIAGADPALLIAAQGVNVSLQLKHSRAFEEEADREGLAILIKTKNDPEGMRRFFQRILAQRPTGGVEIPAYLYTHPAVEQRLAAARTELERLRARGEAPPARPQTAGGDALPVDPRFALIQQRLGEVIARRAGGTGLHARATFDAAKTDGLLAQASEARVEGDDERADALLARAQELEPRDPRPALERAELADGRDDLPAARVQLERALELDPAVPLVQYQLGVVLRRLGDRSRAAFYLEQAVAGLRPNSAARRRAELELVRLEWKLFDATGLGDSSGPTERSEFRPGETVVWWGSIARRFMPHNPAIRVRWRSPSNATAFDETVRMSPLGRVHSEFRLAKAELGEWKVLVTIDDSPVEERSFQIGEP